MTDPRVDELVDAALDRDPEEWTAFLDEACRGDEALRAEVASLLGVHRAHPDLLQPGPPAAAAVPERIGRYAIVREIARGGMGVVYEAQDDALGRPIALKVLPAHLAGDPRWLRRFEREARHLAALEHPNIANVHTLEEADGIRFLTMELVDDPPLAERLADGALPVPRALAVCARIARALETAHRKGIVHCDLKPANVLLSSREDRVTVIDFGLARQREARDAAPAEEAGIRTGTPGYMAPEQIDGARVDERADVWAFGCLAFECLAGTPAFPGHAIERRAATLERDPDWDLLPDGLPASVRDVVVRCLRKEPEDRPRGIAAIRRLLDDEIAGDLAAGEASAVPPHLPTWPNVFVGRAEEVDALARRVGPGRLLTLTGPGGAGKTRLAGHVARRLDARGSRVRFADLAGADDDMRVHETVAAACDVRVDPGTDPLDALADALRGEGLLLILDNCERRLAACRTLAARLLAEGPDVALLATSREPLDVDGEATHAVGRLPVPDAAVDWIPAELAEVDAVALFLARAAEHADFRLTAKNAASVADLCRRLDGIPLALELAATRAAEAIGGAAALEGDARRSLHDVIDWSYCLLAPEERTRFRSLSAFAGGFTADAAGALGGGDATVLHALLRKSLVEIDVRPRPVTGDVRFRLLEPIREFAHSRLTGDEHAALRDRHAAHFAAFAERNAPRLKGPDALAALAAFAADHDNLRAALDHAVDAGDGPTALRLAASMETFWTMRGHWKEGAAATDAALRVPGADVPSPAGGHALNTAALFALHFGEPERADRLYDEALAVGRATGDEEVVARSIHNKGGVALGAGRLADARAHFEEYVAIQRRRGRRDAEVLALCNLGVVAEREGRPADAEALYGEALAAAEETGNRRMTGVLLNNLGATALAAGRTAVARERLERALRLHRDAEDTWALALTLNALGAVDDAEDRATDALRRFRESLRLLDEVGSRDGVADLLTQLGCFAARRGPAAHGAELLGAAEALRERIGTPLAANFVDEVNAAMDTARAALGEDAFREQRERGGALGTDAAVARALDGDDASGGAASPPPPVLG